MEEEYIPQWDEFPNGGFVQILPGEQQIVQPTNQVHPIPAHGEAPQISLSTEEEEDLEILKDFDILYDFEDYEQSEEEFDYSAHDNFVWRPDTNWITIDPIPNVITQPIERQYTIVEIVTYHFRDTITIMDRNGNLYYGETISQILHDNTVNGNFWDPDPEWDRMDRSLLEPDVFTF